MTNPAYEATNSDVEKLIAGIKVDIDKRKSMPPRGDANSNIERLRVINDTMKSFSTESVEKLISALEQAQQNHRLHAARLINERASLKERIAELEAAPNGMMQLSNELAEMKRKCVELEAASVKPVKLPMPYDINVAGERVDLAKGDNFDRDEVIEAIRAAGGTVEGD